MRTPGGPSSPSIHFYNFNTRRPRTAQANAHKLSAYTPNTHIARSSEAYIVCIDRLITPVATFASRKTASEFRLIASSNGGAGVGLGPAIIAGGAPARLGSREGEDVLWAEVDFESLSLLLLLLFWRRTTLSPETGEYVLFASGVGKKTRSRRK